MDTLNIESFLLHIQYYNKQVLKSCDNLYKYCYIFKSACKLLSFLQYLFPILNLIVSHKLSIVGQPRHYFNTATQFRLELVYN